MNPADTRGSRVVNKDWIDATQHEIDNMTFEEAKEIALAHITPKESKGFYSGVKPLTLRPHVVKAIQLILEKAEQNES